MIAKFFLVVLAVCPMMSWGQDCELKKDQDSVLVYTCHQPESKLKSIKANFVVQATLSDIVAKVMDVDGFTSWQYKVIKSTLVKRISERELVFQSQVSAPWPVSNRELVARLSVEQDTRTKIVTITIRAVPDYIPQVDDDIVRVPMSQAVWKITPITIKKQKVEYTFLVDPGGSIPSWLVNMAAAEGPSSTFQNFKKAVHKKPATGSASFIVD